MKRLGNLIILGSWLLLFVSPSFAHGGGDLIAGPLPVGPYTVSVWLNPPDPRATEAIHYTVGVAAPIDGRPVLDAQIMVEMRARGDESPAISAPATTDQSVNKLFYETDFEVPAPGLYETIFYVSGSEGEGTLAVDIEVGSPSRINWLALGLAGLALMVVWGWWRSRKPRQVPDEMRSI